MHMHDFTEIDSTLSQLLDGLVHLSDAARGWARGYIHHDEYRLALETVEHEIIDKGVAISPSDVALMERAASIMSMTLLDWRAADGPGRRRMTPKPASRDRAGEVRRRPRRAIVIAISVAAALDLVAPVIAGRLAIGDRRGPLIYPAGVHATLYLLGRESTSHESTKPRLPPHPGPRPLFYGL